MREMLDIILQHNYSQYISKNCRHRKKLSAGWYNARNQLILLGPVDVCGAFYAGNKH
jgi:hypothetical protein